MSFKEGKSNILTSLNAQEAYINTKLGYIQVVTDYENSLSNLERALGINTGDNDL
jgi:outer membrane protein TolC